MCKALNTLYNYLHYNHAIKYFQAVIQKVKFSLKFDQT